MPIRHPPQRVASQRGSSQPQQQQQYQRGGSQQTSGANTTTTARTSGATSGAESRSDSHVGGNDDPLLLAFERGRVDEERRNLEKRSIEIRSSIHQDAQDIQLQQDDEQQRISRLKSEYEVIRRKVNVVQSENSALVLQINESEESLEETRRQLVGLPASPSKFTLRVGSSPSSVSAAAAGSPSRHRDASMISDEGSVDGGGGGGEDTAILAQLHVAEQRVSALRGEHSALVDASTEVSKRLREASTTRDALSAEVGQLRELDARLKELNRNSATSEAEKLQKHHGRHVAALSALKDRTTAAANERKFLATHLLDGAKDRAMSLKEVRVRSAGGSETASGQFLRSVLDENVKLRRKSRQAMVDFMDERELLQEYVLVLMARIAEATQRLHRDLYDAQVASALKDTAISQDPIGFYASQGSPTRSSSS